LWIGVGAPTDWPQAVDLAIALVCDPNLQGEAAACLDAAGPVPCVTLHLPLLRALEFVPSELERFRKYVQPEPFRPLTVLAAVHELEAVAGRGDGEGRTEEATSEPESFAEITVDFLI